uniref:Ig-like domain-containing protein n=1 Tax=Neogobius melanostomus TaxID=47308 RepID=A0A8C6ST52_9GOBI
MFVDRALVVLMTLGAFWSPLRAADRSVSCLLHSACVLPCPFDPGPEVVIHWLNPPESSSPVHSFYHSKDQLGHQQQRYRGRTSLFKELISKGNASLRITGVELADSGRYKCYTSTTKGNNEDFFSVEVQAPVLEVSLQQEEERLLCRSENIYPRPDVDWTPSPEPLDKPLTNFTSSETGLFSVLSTVPLTQRPLEEYTCNVSTKHSWRSATYRRNYGVTWSGSGTELHCSGTEHSVQSLVWTFNRTQVILRQSESKTVFNQDWNHRVEQGPRSELILKDLSLEQQGLFSCSLTTDRGTYLTVTEVTVSAAAKADHTAVIGGVVGPLLVVLLVIGIVLYKYRCKNKTKSQKQASAAQGPEEEELKPQ